MVNIHKHTNYKNSDDWGMVNMAFYPVKKERCGAMGIHIPALDISYKTGSDLELRIEFPNQMIGYNRR
jgi:hypothetical protein